MYFSHLCIQPIKYMHILTPVTKLRQKPKAKHNFKLYDLQPPVVLVATTRWQQSP